MALERLPMSQVRAEEIIKKTRQTMEDSLSELGLPLREGTINLDGVPITKKMLDEFRTAFDATTRKAIETYFNIDK